MHNNWESVLDLTLDSSKSFVANIVQRSTEKSIRTFAMSSIGAFVRPPVKDSVNHSVKFFVKSFVKSSIGDSIRASSFFVNCAYGSQDADWLGYYDFLMEVCKIKDQKLIPFIDLAKDCGWWLPTTETCFMSEKPMLCNMKDSVLHCEDGPALEYRDGFKIWAIEGICVNEQIVISPESQSVKDIQDENNDEVRRVRLNRLGWHRYLEAINANVLDVSVRPKWIETLIKTDDGLPVLCTYNPSTGIPYVLEVDPSCKTCEDAEFYLLATEDAFHKSGVGVASMLSIIKIL